ncbi:MAG: OmpA family protein [Paraglaciecola sp.]|uniref:OmpA family protein n=1 Tax=Paraglaciecola sp. TaxID=1920173 RepID=UPI00273E36A0|nr:OmpA family protein [Paraglaciecola sp.]MDP5030785.1 OmpA family protein [Paraglaciecola sp.]MDP5039989.1 OmpA family protein [Paraglaciecola sp.]MDP5132151.1 OmpA family protein [Paraglaciecola sp.]
MIKQVNTKLAMAFGLSAFLLTGCANTATNTQKGVGIGAVVGALIGKGTGDNDKSRYAWGAVVGAIAGGAIGQYMDKQEKEFRDELADSGVEVVRDGDNLKLLMPGNITFETGKANISSSFYPVLNDVALVINKYEKTTLQVVGHTDNVGSDSQNQLLSEYRASAVKGYLTEHGVDNRRVSTLGMGEYQPAASNDTDSGRQKNRRVELTIMPLQS